MNLRARGVFALILASFFLSGVAGLIYQVVWTRYLALFLGHTSYAVIAVLAAFMGGLALGNAWLGAAVDRMPRPLLFYAGLELGIGVFAVIFPAYYEFMHQGFLAIVRSTAPTSGFRLALQFAFACATILFPTVLMGATLPALTRFVTRSLSELRGKVAALYAINSSGAVAGVILTDWWWIPSLGLDLTLVLGAVLSLLVGGVALWVSRRIQEGSAPAATNSTAPAAITESFSPRQLQVALLAIGISGFVAMLYEVAWTRLLALALGSSTHAYSLMLATFISGIAAGGWLVYRWKAQTHTLRAFGLAELALAGTLLVSLSVYDLLPWWFSRLASHLPRNDVGYPIYELLQALICFGVMFPPALCLGTTLPLASRIGTVELAQTGKSVGRVFAVNTLGTVLGAVLTGLVFLPYLGLAPTFVLGIALNALAGLLLWNSTGQKGRGPWIMAGTVVVLGLWASSVLEPRWQKAFTLGLWRAKQVPNTLTDYRAQVDRVDLRYHRNGAGSTVSVMATTLPDGRESLALRVNGKTDATSVGDLATQVLLAHVPMLYKPQSSEVLIVGLGSGVTVGSVLEHPSVKRVDVVEISPEVVRAAQRFFSPVNHQALDDKRTHLHLEDAKTFLQTTLQRYDLVVSEPSNPWMAGVAAVFSQEFYVDVRDQLKPEGVAAQWLQAYEMDDHTVDLVINTFSSVFPHVGIWHPGGRDLVLLGSLSPISPDSAALGKLLEHPGLREDFKRVGITDIPSLLSLELVPFGEGLFVPDPATPVHSDRHPVLEYAAQRAFFLRKESQKVFSISEARSPRPRGILSSYLSGRSLTATEFRAAGELFKVSSIPDPEIFRSQMWRWLELEPEAVDPVRLLSALEHSLATPDASAVIEATLPGMRAARERGDITLMRSYAHALMTIHRARRSAYFLPPTDKLEQTLRRLIELDVPQRRVHRARLAEILWDRKDDSQFMAVALKAFGMDSPDNGPYDFSADVRAPRLVIARMLLLMEQRGDMKMALQIIREAVQKGFAGEEAPIQEPLLEHHARRILAKATPTGI